MTSQPHDGVYTIEEYTGPDAAESVRELWERLQTHPNADIDFFSTVVKSRPEVVNPVVLEVRRSGMPVALAACRLEKVVLAVSLGYFKIARHGILQLTVVYGGLMGEWDDEAAVAFIRHVRRLMRLCRIDAVHLAAMRPDNPVYRTARRIVPFFLRDNGLEKNLHWWADLPETFETFQKKINSKHRAQLRSKERKLAEHFGATIQVRSFHAPHEVRPFCMVAEKIAQATYLRGLGEGFYDNGEMRNRLDLAARMGWFHGYVLYADETPCAFWLGTAYRHVFHLDYTGFDSALKDFAPGQILFINMIEILCGEGGINGVDFGFGDAEYKQRYGDRNWVEADLYLFNATPAMLLANGLRKTTALLRRIAEKPLKRFDLVARIKKKWRVSAEKTVRGQEQGKPDDHSAPTNSP